MDIVVRDYLAAAEVKIGVRGLTVFRGASGSGKSSTFRALMSAVSNRWSGGSVRWGTTGSEVAIRFDAGGPVLKVTKGIKGGAVYDLAGVRYDKVGRSVPEEVKSFLNMGVERIGDEDFHLSFCSQWVPPLLLRFSQSKVRELLGGGGGLNDWQVCWSELGRRGTELRAFVREAESRVADCRPRAEALEKLVASGSALEERLKAYKSRRDAIEEQLLGLRRLRYLYGLHWYIMNMRVNAMLVRRATGSMLSGRMLHGVFTQHSDVCKALSALHMFAATCNTMESALLEHARRKDIYVKACVLLTEQQDLECGIRRYRAMAYHRIESLRALKEQRSKLSEQFMRVWSALGSLNTLRAAMSDLAYVRKELPEARRLLSGDVCPLCGGAIGGCVNH